MGIEIAYKEPDLKEQHTGDPQGRGASEPREDHSGDHRLDLEEQEAAEKDSDSVREHGIFLFASLDAQEIRA
jgi:hypothetical protein